MAYPPLAPANILEIVVKGRLFGQRTENTFHYYAAVVIGDVTLLDVFTNFAVHFQDEFEAVTTTDWTSDTITVRRITPDPTRAIPFGNGWTGTNDEGTLPPSTTAVISRVSWQQGRRSLGRIFVPAVPNGWHSNGELTVPAMAAYASLAAKMDTSVIEGGTLTLKPILWDREGSALRDIEEAFARKILRQQRRREIGVGE